MGDAGFFALYVGLLFGVAALVAFAADHLPEQLAEDFARIMGVATDDYTPLDDDPERKQADHDRWDKRKREEEGTA